MSNKVLFFKTGFPRAPLGLGIGRYVCQLQRVTLKFCKNHGGSRGMRDFIEHDLLDYAKENPGVVVYLKPRRHRSPVICAEYLNGEKQWVAVTNYTRDDIVKWFNLLRTQFHDGTQLRLRKLWHTEYPSIQGPWTPFTFRNPTQNLLNFPNEEIGATVKDGLTATERLIELYQSQRLSEESKEMQKKQKNTSSVSND